MGDHEYSNRRESEDHSSQHSDHQSERDTVFAVSYESAEGRTAESPKAGDNDGFQDEWDNGSSLILAPPHFL